MSDQELETRGSADGFGAGPQAQPDAGASDTTRAGPSLSGGSWSGPTRANLALIALSLASLGCIYFLSPRDGPQTASGDQKLAELRVDNALSNLARPNAANRKALEVVDTFYYQAKHRQIPLKDLKSNPFIFKAPERPKPTTQPVPKESPAAPKKTEKAPAEEMEEVRKLVLQSVLTGSREPVAMISNNLLTEGQKICGWTLTRIKPRSVTLTWQDKTYVLRMSQ
ncbi:MAG: hypothetical protein ISS78_09595 [Phycisphaerae bacterium]|nr:hypothetical protein [Phycisphaerae bacterium]